MALVWACSFDRGQDNTLFNGEFDGGATSTTTTQPGRNGNGYLCNIAVGNQQYYASAGRNPLKFYNSNGGTYDLVTTTNINFFAYHLYITTMPGAGKRTRQLITVPTGQRNYGHYDTGKMYVYDGTTTIQSTNTFQTGRWYWVAILQNRTTGDIADKVYVYDTVAGTGSLWIDDTSLAQTISATTRLTVGGGDTKGDDVGSWTIDNLIWANDKGNEFNTYAEMQIEKKCLHFRPSGDGGYTEFTKNGSASGTEDGTYTQWDDAPTIDDTTYNYEDRTGAKRQTSTIPSAATIGIDNPPHGLVLRARYDPNGSVITNFDEAMIYDGTNEVRRANWDSVDALDDQMPATFAVNPAGAAWTIADIANLQVGAYTNLASFPTNRQFTELYGTFVLDYAAPSTLIYIGASHVGIGAGVF